jgi:Flp pilus assembly protein TadD
MGRLVCTLSVLAMLVLTACGEREGSTSGAVAGDARPPVNAAATVPRAAAPEEEPAEAPELSAEAEACLALVNEGNFDEAVKTCLRAHRENPDDARLRDVLALAEQGQRMSDDIESEERARQAEDARRAVSDADR